MYFFQVNLQNQKIVITSSISPSTPLWWYSYQFDTFRNKTSYYFLSFLNGVSLYKILNMSSVIEIFYQRWWLDVFNMLFLQVNLHHQKIVSTPSISPSTPLWWYSYQLDTFRNETSYHFLSFLNVASMHKILNMCFAIQIHYQRWWLEVYKMYFFSGKPPKSKKY